MTCSVYKFTDQNFEEKNGCVPCASVCNELSVLNSGIYPTAGIRWVSKETHDACTGCVPELREWWHGLQGYSSSLLSAIKPVHVCHLQCCLFSFCCLKLLQFWWWWWCGDDANQKQYARQGKVRFPVGVIIIIWSSILSRPSPWNSLPDRNTSCHRYSSISFHTGGNDQVSNAVFKYNRRQ